MEVEVVLEARVGCGLILLTLTFFHILQQLVALAPLPRTLTHTPHPPRIFRWRNLVVSWLHACITGTTTVICLVVYGSDMWKDMVEYCNWPIYFVSCFSTGYFIFDTYDIIRARQVKQKWEIMIHHAAIIVSTLYVISWVHCVAYHVMAMLVELNTAFLHFRKLLQIAAIPRTNWGLQCNRYLNLVTFILFRFLPLTILTLGVYFDGHRIPRWFLFIFSFAMLTLNIVNIILFYRLFKTDVWFGYTKQLKTKFHRKLNSTAGMCGSLQVSSDCNGFSSQPPSREPSASSFPYLKLPVPQRSAKKWN